MANTKKEKNKWIELANEAIKESPILEEGGTIKDSYNGQIAAFPVAVALSGLKPAMAVYNNDKSSTKVDRRKIIALLAAMYSKDKSEPTTSDQLYEKVLAATSEELTKLTSLLSDYAIALKLTIRTFKLVK